MVERKKQWMELLGLMCRCGARVEGLVGHDRVHTAIDLFKAHHTGPKCQPSYTLREPDNSPWMVGRQKRLSPSAVCGSAWWTVARRKASER